MAQNQQQILRFIRGLFKDTSPIDQPMGSYRYAKNAIIADTTGAISNEPGIKNVATLPTGAVVIGTIPLTDNRIVLCIKYGAQSEVGIYSAETYETILRLPPSNITDTDLNFQEKYPISGSFKEQADGDVIVYITDKLNPPRAINITRQSNSAVDRLYGKDLTTTPDTKLIDLLNLFPHTGPVPHIELDNVYSGGGCTTGVYFLALAYSDEDLTETNYVTIANPVSIVDDPEGISPIESYDGAEPNTKTGKSIVWSISNINTDMKYLVPQIIQRINGVDTVVKISSIEINNSSTKTIMYSGEETQAESSPDSVVVDNVEYSTVKTIEQLDGRLYLGNLTSNEDVGYQSYANHIKARAVTHVFPNFDPFEITNSFLTNNISYTGRNDRGQGYRDPKNIFNLKGYQRDEVYAFYIAFILKSGKTTYAYHIPGREALKDVVSTEVNELMGDVGFQPALVNEGESLLDNQYGQVGDYQIIGLTGGLNPGETPKGHLYHFYDFSHLTTYGSRGMNHWHNLHEFYPNTSEFRTINASNPGILVPDEDLRGKNVRHHRFPGNKNSEYTTVKAKFNEDNTYERVFDNVGGAIKEKLVVRWFWFGYMTDEGPGYATEGKVLEEDFQTARDFQETVGVSQGNRKMGGYHPINVAGAQSYNLYPQKALGELSGLTYTNFLGFFPAGSAISQAQDENVYNDTDAANACHPEANTTFRRVLLNQPSNNNPRLSDPDRPKGLPTSSLITCDSGIPSNISYPEDVEFIYDAQARVRSGTKVFVAYDRPYGESIGGCFEPHCSGMGIGTANSDDGSIVRFSVQDWQNRCNGVAPPKDTMNPNAEAWSRPGWMAWVDCENELQDDAANVIDHEVQALGIEFSDIKIPQTIADKIQGFRIYYAKREQENKTILGQAPIHPMQIRNDMDISGCDGGGVTRGLIDYYMPSGLPVPRKDDPAWPVSHITFNDFHLLKYRPSISQATHIKFQYTLCFANFKGHVDFYSDTEEAFYTDETNNLYSCKKPDTITSFHLSGNHFRIQGNSERLNYVLEGKSKKYLNGGIIYDGTAENFGKKLYTIGGHSTLALKTLRFIPYLASANALGEGWRKLRGDGSGISFVSYTENSYAENAPKEGLQLHMANLQAFKTDVYNKTDLQDLVWTGYEVTGEEINRFVVDKNGNPIQYSGVANRFMTEKVFGGDTYISRYGYRMTSREEVDHDGNFPNTGSIDNKSVIMTIVESPDNINFRDIREDGKPYFPGTSLKEVLDVEANVDLSFSTDPDTGNLRYNNDYSAVNDVKTIVPFPWTFDREDRFPVRVLRSSQASSSALIDNYRQYVFSEYRDLNNRYGELWKISAFNNILLFHMEDALYKTKGKQQMKVSQGGQAYVGQGDIFEQLPDLVEHVDSGYIGTRSQYAALATPAGYFFVDNIDRKIFLVKQGVEDLSGPKYGMKNWLQDHIPYHLEDYGYHGKIDSFIAGMGFHAVWDERFQRVILTKRDLKPTATFLELWKGSFNSLMDARSAVGSGIVYVQGIYYYIYLSPTPPLLGAIEIELNDTFAIEGTRGTLFKRDSWTISFSFGAQEQGKAGAWESFHDYVPYMYSYSKIDVHSFSKGDPLDVNSWNVWRHNDYDNFSTFYGVRYPFTIDVISNMVPQIDKVYSSFNFLVETKENENGQFLINDLHAGFTKFMTFGQDTSSGLHNLEYLVNIKKNGSEWSVNNFRDLSKEVTDTSAYLTGPYLGSSYILPNQNIVGGQNQGTVTSISESIFTVSGMDKDVNPNFTDPTKPWYQQGKFIGKYMGIRLVADNSANKLINLYSVLSDFRPYRR